MTLWNTKSKQIIPKKQEPIARPDIYQVEMNETIFLESLIAQKKEVQVFLMGGIKLTGVLVGMDDYIILMTTKRYQCQLIYKHAVSTISIKDKDNDPWDE